MVIMMGVEIRTLVLSAVAVVMFFTPTAAAAATPAAAEACPSG